VAESPLPEGPAFYAQPSFLTRPRWREWWIVLHPPYTMLHLSLVTVGACLAGPVNTVHWIATLLAFFLAVGIGAHALDELNGRPLKTTIPSGQLVAAAFVGLGGAVALGIAGMFLVSPYLALFIAVGVVAAVGYNLELFGGRLHTSLVFVLSWGAFPILTAYFAQHVALSLASVVAAIFGALVVKVQQILSTPARDLRRRVTSIEGTFTRVDGSRENISKESLLRPFERALKTLCWMGVALAVALTMHQYIR
jgi:asparagine N-glycosylation enzyme membrane subunit Stt3